MKPVAFKPPRQRDPARPTEKALFYSPVLIKIEGYFRSLSCCELIHIIEHRQPY